VKVRLRRISGAFNDGYALDKHTASSVFVGHNEYGHPQFDTTRTPAGEAVFQLKYRGDFDQAKPLAKAVVRNIVPYFPKIGLVMPAPASTARQRQPVHEVAGFVAERMDVPLFDNLIEKSAVASNTGSLKNMNTRQEKDEALQGRYLLNKPISNEGRWNVLVVDDLYHTGATMDAICSLLAQYDKISGVYVAALTWR
jgi:predicted amidophosphoribosyltransferase|tara:strand:- start:9341 stop:9931 length:591 start_codon:yes stop_codon:yes gene_type:complete